MFKYGKDQLLKGIDDERKMKGQINGILEFYGFFDMKAKTIPIISSFEQLGEASIQTGLAVVFLVNNYEIIHKLDCEGTHGDFTGDCVLGLRFPISVISLIFSVISFLLGFCRIAKIVYSYCTKTYHRIATLEF